MNYEELRREVPRMLFAENSELTRDEVFSVILARAKDQVVNLLDHDAFKTTLSNRRIGPDGILDLTGLDPRVLEIRSVRVRIKDDQAVPTYPLLTHTLEALASLYADGVPGAPRYYAEDGDEPLIVRVFPQPASYVFAEVGVNREPAPVTASNCADSVLTGRYARLHDAAVLRHAALWMKDYAALERYDAELAAAVAEMNPAVARRRRDETGPRARDTANATGL